MDKEQDKDQEVIDSFINDVDNDMNDSEFVDVDSEAPTTGM